MSEGKVSKTARASTVRAVKEKPLEETTEEAIRQIRIDRQGGIFVTRMDRVDKLLEAYDKLTAATKGDPDRGIYH